MYFMPVILYVFLLGVAECCNMHFGVFILYIHIVLHVNAVNNLFSNMDKVFL